MRNAGTTVSPCRMFATDAAVAAFLLTVTQA